MRKPGCSSNLLFRYDICPEWCVYNAWKRSDFLLSRVGRPGVSDRTGHYSPAQSATDEYRLELGKMTGKQSRLAVRQGSGDGSLHSTVKPNQPVECGHWERWEFLSSGYSVGCKFFIFDVISTNTCLVMWLAMTLFVLKWAECALKAKYQYKSGGTMQFSCPNIHLHFHLLRSPWWYYCAHINVAKCD